MQQAELLGVFINLSTGTGFGATEHPCSILAWFIITWDLAKLTLPSASLWLIKKLVLETRRLLLSGNKA